MASISTRMSTHWCDTAWFTPIGRPNCSRFDAWSTASASAPPASPTAYAVSTTVWCASARASVVASPSTQAGVTTASSKVTDAYGSGAKVSWRALVTPGVAASTATIADVPSGSRTLTTKRSATAPKGTATFVPEITQPSSCSRAVTMGALRSSPPPGSTSARAAIPSPVARRVSQSPRSASEPVQSSGRVAAYDDSSGSVAAPRPSSSARIASSSAP